MFSSEIISCQCACNALLCRDIDLHNNGLGTWLPNEMPRMSNKLYNLNLAANNFCNLPRWANHSAEGSVPWFAGPANASLYVLLGQECLVTESPTPTESMSPSTSPSRSPTISETMSVTPTISVSPSITPSVKPVAGAVACQSECIA